MTIDLDRWTSRDSERYEAFVYPEPNTGCRLWAGTTSFGGHGRFWFQRKFVSATRLAVLLAGRTIPANLHVLHRCDTPCCVNPDHLFFGTEADNAIDKARKGRGRTGKYLYGVRPQGCRFVARIRIGGELRILGLFPTELEAHLVAIAAKKAHYNA